MPGQFKRTRLFGACVIAMSLISNSVGAASALGPYTISMAPTALTATPDGADVIKVDHRRGYGRRSWDDRDGRMHDRRHDRRFDGRRHAERHHDRWHEERRYKNGHRGYPDYRPGYRRNNDGWWFPLAAFALGAIILNQQTRTPTSRQSYTPPYGGWSHIPAGNMRAHDDWCDRQYRSYSRTTKTYQPYQGPRKFCNSPYDLL